MNQQDMTLWAAVDYLLNSPHNEHTLHGELTSVTVSAHAWEQLRIAFEKQSAL